MEEKISKLPKWAKQLIRSKDRRIENLQAKLNFDNDNKKSDLYYYDYSDCCKRKYIVSDRVFYFILEGDKYISVELEKDKKTLVVMGSRSLSIDPKVSNSIALKVKD